MVAMIPVSYRGGTLPNGHPPAGLLGAAHYQPWCDVVGVVSRSRQPSVVNNGWGSP